jgi:hypothetical protein
MQLREEKDQFFKSGFEEVGLELLIPFCYHREPETKTNLMSRFEKDWVLMILL